MRQAVLEGWTRSVSLAFIYQQLVFYATLHIAHIRQHTDIHICILYMYICTYIHTHRNVACFCRTIIACKTGMSKVCLWANNYRTSVRVCMHATKHQPTIAFCGEQVIPLYIYISLYGLAVVFLQTPRARFGSCYTLQFVCQLLIVIMCSAVHVTWCFRLTSRG